MLDEHDGPARRQRADELHRLVRLLGAHAGGGLVQEQQGRIGRQRDPDLQVPLLAMREMGGQVCRLRRQAHRPEDRERSLAAVRESVRARPEVERAAVALHGHPHVLQHGQMREDIRDLVGLGDAQAGHAMLGQPGDVAPVEPHPSRGGRHLPRHQAEEGGLAGAVRPDDRAQLAAANRQVDAIDGEEATEGARESLGSQEDGVSAGGHGDASHDVLAAGACQPRHGPRCARYPTSPARSERRATRESPRIRPG